MGFRNFLGDKFFLVGPPPIGNGDLVVFWPVLGRGHIEKFWDWAKNRKTLFLGARGHEVEKKSYHAIRDGCPQIFTLYVFPDWTPRGGKSRNAGILGHFGPEQPLALGEIPGAGSKRKNAVSRR